MDRSYEATLDQDTEWALCEGSRYFEGQGAVHESLRELAARLDSLEIPYAAVGGISLFLHGFRRFTENVNVLVGPENLPTIHERLVGFGYVPLYHGSKNLRDVARGVRIEFLVTGGFPGDGKPKPIAFPDPAGCFVDKAGIRCVPLLTLLELKLASGMSNAGRLRDLADAQELIRHLNLPLDLAEQLDSSVREKFAELWSGVNQDQMNP